MFNTRDLPLALQLVMETDGTVTDLVRRLFQENVRVEKLSEEVSQDQNDAQQRLLHRRIFLRGESTNMPRVYAESIIWLDRIPQSFAEGLTEQAIPIGTLWREYRLETFKEITFRGEEQATAEDFNDDRALLVRSYRVYNQQQVIMEITEKFPVEDYRQLSIVSG
jgi:chorismate-pyruvate lyase